MASPSPFAMSRTSSRTRRNKSRNNLATLQKQKQEERTMATQTLPAEPQGRHQSKKAAASGWIGSALEYYDFFIYATAASLIFPQLFFPSGNPTVAIVASLATYGVGYVSRPIGAFVLGHWGDTHGRKTV